MPREDVKSEVFSHLKVMHGYPFGDKQTKDMINNFFNLGFDISYDFVFNAKEIAKHVYGYMVACSNKIAGKVFSFAEEGDAMAFYYCGASHQNQMNTMARIEKWLMSRESKYGKTHATSIRSYHSRISSETVILFTAEKVPFIDPSGKGKHFRELTTEKFLITRNTASQNKYMNIMRKMQKSIVPVHTVNRLDGDMLALKMCFIPDRISYLTSLITLIHNIPGADVIRKVCETFSNGMHVYTFYVRNATPEQLDAAAYLITMLPHRPDAVTTKLYNDGIIDANEVIYCNALRHFAYYFTPPTRTEDFTELSRELGHHPMSVTRLKKMRNEMYRQIMDQDLISCMIIKHVGLLKMLYQDFANGSTRESVARLETECMAQLMPVTNAQEREIFRTFLTFNRSVLKTNFFKHNKSAVIFRLDPSFVGNMDYPRIPYGIYFLVGPQFIGFHVRFTDIARGGVRMIISNAMNYGRNRTMLFTENYNLAYAQLMKNKDIPEGGSKGTILVDPTSTYDKKRTFLQYIDALCDLLVPGTPDIRGSMKGTEILFLGPDEHTAGDFPAIAAMHAKARGYKQWKSFTTGKDPKLGGIPHDHYGMTSRGVRTYVEGVYEKLGLNGNTLTKFQTGGPDGDLGSNEILLSHERYVALVDGSGSIHDPEGIDREELTRLAKERKMLRHFDTSKLSPKGFFVGIEEKNRKLPDGTMVPNGERFRNVFHVSKYCRADTFVPCGGRPASLNLDNVHLFIDVPGVKGQDMIEGKVGNLAGSGKLRFKYIIEGANLFITHDARIALESVGVVLIKDSSANKGGVTCSSFEVLSGLVLNDKEHAEHMCVKADGTIPQFYEQYVNEVISMLGKNARKEFECLWVERKRGTKNGSMTLISDVLSSKIVQMRQFIIESDLHKDQALFQYVLKQYMPPSLLEKVPIAHAIEHIPINYQHAMFGVYIASDFVYSTGLDANEFSFFVYMHNLIKKAHGVNDSKL